VLDLPLSARQSLSCLALGYLYKSTVLATQLLATQIATSPRSKRHTIPLDHIALPTVPGSWPTQRPTGRQHGPQLGHQHQPSHRLGRRVRRSVVKTNPQQSARTQKSARMRQSLSRSGRDDNYETDNKDQYDSKTRTRRYEPEPDDHSGSDDQN